MAESRLVGVSAQLHGGKIACSPKMTTSVIGTPDWRCRLARRVIDSFLDLMVGWDFTVPCRLSHETAASASVPDNRSLAV
jgi:hypothetical protein